MRLLTCGCAPCGCACELHAPSRRPTPCAHHALTSAPKWLIQELGTIVALGLFVACAAVWIGVFSKI